MPDYLYHVTYLFNLPSIAQEGLMPSGGGPSVFKEYEAYSAGWTHLTEAEGISYWSARIENHADANTEHPEDGWVPVVLKIPIGRKTAKTDHLVLELDEVGTEDASADAWRTRSKIPAENIEYWEPAIGDWLEISEFDDEAFQDALDEVKAASNYEEDEDEPGEGWWWMDFDYFLPPEEELS